MILENFDQRPAWIIRAGPAEISRLAQDCNDEMHEICSQTAGADQKSPKPCVLYQKFHSRLDVSSQLLAVGVECVAIYYPLPERRLSFKVDQLLGVWCVWGVCDCRCVVCRTSSAAALSHSWLLVAVDLETTRLRKLCIRGLKFRAFVFILYCSSWADQLMMACRTHDIRDLATS